MRKRKNKSNDTRERNRMKDKGARRERVVLQKWRTARANVKL